MADEPQNPDQTPQPAPTPPSEPLPQSEANAPSELAQPVSEAEPAPKPAEPVPNEPIEAKPPETPTAQIPANEPLPQNNEPLDIPPLTTRPRPCRNSRAVPQARRGRDLLTKARETIQNKKQKKLEKILSLFATKDKITNDEVENFCTSPTRQRRDICLHWRSKGKSGKSDELEKQLCTRSTLGSRRDSIFHGGDFARAWWRTRAYCAGSGASAFAFAPRAFSLGRPGRRMSAAVLLQFRNPKAEATPRTQSWKRGRGLCDGRTLKARQCEAQSLHHHYYPI